jgi:hypothetical protein
VTTIWVLIAASGIGVASLVTLVEIDEDSIIPNTKIFSWPLSSILNIKADL